jgi:hypothetical protein
MTRSAPSLLGLAAVLLAAACTSSSGTSATGNGGSGGGGGGTGGGSACPNAPALTAPSPACNTVTNGATAIPFTTGTGTPPTPAGGTVVDGVYYATQASGYNGATPAGRKLTIVILGGGTQMLWAGQVLDATGTTSALTFTANATASASGTQIAMSTTCMSTTMSPLPAALDYTATANQLVLSLTTNGATSVTTYTRQGCP